MDNYTRAIRFQKPDYIPMIFAINGACWDHYPKEALWDLMEEHKHLFHRELRLCFHSCSNQNDNLHRSRTEHPLC